MQSKPVYQPTPQGLIIVVASGMLVYNLIWWAWS